MSPQRRRGGGWWPSPPLLATLALLAACEGLPTGYEGRMRLDVRLVSLDPILIGDTTILVADVRDPEGNRLVDPPLVWAFEPLEWSPPLQVVGAEGNRARVQGVGPGTVRVRVAVIPGHRDFSSNIASGDLPVRYGPVTVRFENVASDTVLDARGRFDLHASAVDHRGRPVRAGELQVQGRAGGPIEVYYAYDGRIDASAEGIGVDTLIATHSLCEGPCGDTLVVHVEPVPAGLSVPYDVRVISLGQPFDLPGSVVDANHYEIPGAVLEWQLVHPGDSGIVRILEPSGAALSVANGTALVKARHAEFQGDLHVRVHQEVYWFDARVPPHVTGIGTEVTARLTAWDAMRNLIEPTHTIQHVWSTDRSSVAVVSEVRAREALLETRGLGSTVVGVEVLTCLESWNCGWQRQGFPLRVIPDPDSVRIVHDPDLTLPAVGSTLQLHGDIYLPDEEIRGVPLFWTALDRSVATVDDDGVVTAVAPGYARIEGRMGAATDTVTVRVETGG